MARQIIRIGIDIGSKNVRATLAGANRTVTEPAVFALEINGGRILAFGEDASKMAGKIPGSMQTIRPFAGDVTTDRQFVACAVQSMMKKLLPEKPGAVEVAICLSGVPDRTMDGYAVTAAQEAGADTVYIVDTLLAAAKGAGANIDSDIVMISSGASVTDMGIFSHGELVCSRTVTAAGNAIDRMIADAVYEKHGIRISESEAEKVKLAVASVGGINDEKTVKAVGIHKYEGVPRKITVGGSEFSRQIKEMTEEIVDAVYSMFYDVKFEISQMILAGGTAQLKGLAETLAEQINVPVKTADDPASCVINGLTQLLEDGKLF